MRKVKYSELKNKNIKIIDVQTKHEFRENHINGSINIPYDELMSNYKSYLKKENIYFICSTMLKPEVIMQHCKHFNIDIKDVVFVDDRIDVLRKAEEMGINAYHPSSFTE